MRRWARRGCFALAATCLTIAVVSPNAGAAEEDEDDVARPSVWGGNAQSLAVSIELNRDALLPVPDLFKFIALDTASTYGSSSQAARASIVFPGNGAILGPSLACGTFGGQFPPEFKPILDTCLKYQYPLTVFADEFDPDASTNGSLAFGTPKNDIALNATTARAHAAIDGSNSDAVVQDLRVLGIPPFGPLALPGSEPLKLDTSIVDIDSVTSRTDQRIVSGGLVTTAKATLSGVKLIGGLIRIGSLVSESTVTDSASGKRTSEANFQATGVTVAGVPAQLTNKGLALGPGDKTPIPAQLKNALAGVLEALDIKFTVLPTDETLNRNGQAHANVGGLLIEFARDVQGLPPVQGPVGEIDLNGNYVATVQLGLTGAIGSAANFDVEGDVLDNLEDDLGDFGGDFSSGFGFDDTGAFTDGGGFASTGALGGGGRDTSNGGSDGGSSSLVRSVSDNFGDRLGLVYLALMLSVLALAIAPRLAVPARLPGNKS
jgi:hypothetical protein